MTAVEAFRASFVACSLMATLSDRSVCAGQSPTDVVSALFDRFECRRASPRGWVGNKSPRSLRTRTKLWQGLPTLLWQGLPTLLWQGLPTLLWQGLPTLLWQGLPTLLWRLPTLPLGRPKVSNSELVRRPSVPPTAGPGDPREPGRCSSFRQGLLRSRVAHDQEHGPAARPLAGPFAADEVVAGPCHPLEVFVQEPQEDAVALADATGLVPDQSRDVEQGPPITADEGI